MERLTFEGNFCDIAQCDVISGGSYCESSSCTQRKVWEQLKAYEDTGLTPEQCENAKIIIESAFSDDTSKAERIRELLKADKDGRLVVLPCKVGDTVYILRRTFDGADVVGEAELWWDDIPQFGKNVFLTREEAEAALEAMKQ